MLPAAQAHLPQLEGKYLGMLPVGPTLGCTATRGTLCSALSSTCLCWAPSDKDTVLDNPVFQASQVLHHDVDEAGHEPREDPYHGTNDPALDLHRPEGLRGRHQPEAGAVAKHQSQAAPPTTRLAWHCAGHLHAQCTVLCFSSA